MSKQFTLSQNIGAAVRYFFTPNPSEYIVPEISFNSINILEGQNVRQRPWDNQLIYTMRWANAPSGTYINLISYTNRNNNDNIPISYFYDGEIGNFPARFTSVETGSALVSGTPVKVLDVVGKPLIGQYDLIPAIKAANQRYSIDMKIIKVT